MLPRASGSHVGMRCRRRPRPKPVLAWTPKTILAAIASVFLGTSVAPALATNVDNLGQTPALSAAKPSRLAVLVPVYKHDVDKALASLALWPTVCSPESLTAMDLILYKAEGEDEKTSLSLAKSLKETAGNCFASTKVVYANVDEKDNFYPKGPSVQFYKLFLDGEVRQHLVEYDALVIIEWDVLVARDTSFQQLYHITFDGAERFWVKGSVLAGSNFHSVAANSDMWHVMGHINGNAIYNNSDEDFIEFVKFALARWQYEYPYDVALWATISDFPYSWPLWQRYSSKFVTTNLISNVGYENVDATAVRAAIAGDTLFIHGSNVEGGSRTIVQQKRRLADVDPENMVSCQDSCGDADGLPPGYSTVCDVSCDIDDRFGGYLCGAGDHDKYGSSCRLCYTDQAIALEAEAQLRQLDSANLQAKHVIMCDTKRPPDALDCDSECALKTDTVCDHTCGVGRYGDYNCNWRNHGTTCRYCFNDVDAALVADEVAKRHDGRVIMCDTHEPPVFSVAVNAVNDVAVASRQLTKSGGTTLDDDEEEPKWRKDQRWKRRQKWKKDGTRKYKKWKRMQKWKNGGGTDDSSCTEECANLNGEKGRVCDPSCSDSNPLYGTRGCGCNGARYGTNCRTCYNDLEAARRLPYVVIMCETLAPPDIYARRLTQIMDSSDIGPADSEESGSADGHSADSDFTAGEVVIPPPADASFVPTLVQSDICVFMESNAAVLGETEVTVRSVSIFMPGMRIALVVASEDFDLFERTFEASPSVLVSETTNPGLSAFLADDYCGRDAELIYYLAPGALLSRPFTAKDTHSPRGDLLVVYSEGRGADHATLASAEATRALLGFDAPIFTYGTDLILPAFVNAQLRELIESESEFDQDKTLFEFVIGLDDINPAEVLAAFAYKQNYEGVWFLNPQTWVTQHLFKAVSIWDIPLVKPRFSCSLDPSVDVENLDLTRELSRELDSFIKGASCESGFLRV